MEVKNKHFARREFRKAQSRGTCRRMPAPQVRSLLACPGFRQARKAQIKRDLPAYAGFRQARKAQLKGQFLILGAFLVCALFYMGLPKSAYMVTPVSYDLKYLSDNLEKEIPNALNLGLGSGKPMEYLMNFTHFAEDVLRGRAINYSSLWLVARNQSSDLNITIGNFLGSNATVNLTIGAATSSVYVPNNSTNGTLFAAPGAAFNLTIVFVEQNYTADWQRDKASIYAFTELKRGDAIQIREIAG